MRYLALAIALAVAPAAIAPTIATAQTPTTVPESLWEKIKGSWTDVASTARPCSLICRGCAVTSHRRTHSSQTCTASRTRSGLDRSTAR